MVSKKPFLVSEVWEIKLDEIIHILGATWENFFAISSVLVEFFA
jgi:hypothetical protein